MLESLRERTGLTKKQLEKYAAALEAMEYLESIHSTDNGKDPFYYLDEIEDGTCTRQVFCKRSNCGYLYVVLGYRERNILEMIFNLKYKKDIPEKYRYFDSIWSKEMGLQHRFYIREGKKRKFVFMSDKFSIKE